MLKNKLPGRRKTGRPKKAKVNGCSKEGHAEAWCCRRFQGQGEMEKDEEILMEQCVCVCVWGGGGWGGGGCACDILLHKF